MNVEVTLSVPNTVLEHAAQLGRLTKQSVEDVLADKLEIMDDLWPILDDLPYDGYSKDVSDLSDDEVLELAHMTMTEIQDERLSHLQAKGKQKNLNIPEQYELIALMQIYRIGLLRKSEGLAEAVRRGLIPPLNS
ncbi:hypothetical protein KFU94_17225 [Chloroflexi bacterium TSY]|nr:hypothetical protein [Chloroflexi bacterium TSY]